MKKSLHPLTVIMLISAVIGLAGALLRGLLPTAQTGPVSLLALAALAVFTVSATADINRTEKARADSQRSESLTAIGSRNRSVRPLQRESGAARLQSAHRAA